MKYQGKNLKTVTTLPNTGDVDDFEKYLEMKLPDDYKQFLITCNGGKPEDCMGFDVVVRSFFGITEDYNYSLKHHLNIYTQANRMPKNILPIGNDNGGNCICISLAKNDYGHIYFWDHDGETSGYENLVSLSNSFSEFIQGLGPEVYDF